MDDLRKDPFEEYQREREPGKRERYESWRTAIGLQAVDALVPSDYLLETAKRHIEGELSINQVKDLITSYYEENPKNDKEGSKEADLVSARIEEILNEKAFTFSSHQFLSIHKRLFSDLLPHAGEFRDYNITKKEWVLDGASVTYGNADNLQQNLDYDLSEEKNYSYKELSMPEVIRHLATFVSRLWQNHIFGEGNTRTTAVFLIKYLRTLGFEANNEPFAEHSWYFRNALVRANYNDLQNGVHETTEYLEFFLRNLLLGENNELHNRAIHISGAFKKQDIEVEKQDIEVEKQDIGQDFPYGGVLKAAGFKAKRLRYVEKLYQSFGKERVFGRGDVVEILGITSSPASELLKRLLDTGVIVPVSGKGKGKYRFARSV
ncbi:MAG: Fic family protein [Actinomycetaceae bacterium]|nr:Fic family protein [Actinomycetaceae bacterium]